MITEKLIDQLNFDTIAEKILNSTELLINEKRFRICEIEIYFRSENHNDEYTHCNKDQSLFEKFYFHKYPNGTYKGGTYKGMDITFGKTTEEKNRYFGILIRSIYNIRDNEFIEGPCRVVNKILELNGHDNIRDMIGNRTLSIYNEKIVSIVHTDNLEFKNIYSGPRIGLSDKYPHYRNKNYRYVIYKNKIKKEKKKLELII